MNIGRQWEDRLRIWGEELQKRYLSPCMPLEMEFFTTMDHLTFAEATQGAFQPAPAGLAWGRKWEYGWFRTRITVPEALKGRRLVVCLNVGEEMLVWVNGVESGAIDKKHRHLTLTRCAVPGETYEIIAECYAGHGPRKEGAGPVAWDEIAVPEPPEKQVTVAKSFLAEWNEPLFQASMDYHTLWALVKKLPEKSLRAMQIIKGLKQFTLIADFELPEPALTHSVTEAARVLQPLLRCKNGSTAPEFTVFGQSHLDMAWLWPVEETMRKSARTYTNQLALMDEYEDYRFLLCEPPILEYLRTLYPNVYDRVLEKVRSGAFLPEGALWIESDTNIPSGESLIRQFVRGRRWFREKLGVESRMAWMPDTFGFSPALPQIMQGCGVSCFATQKLVRQDPEADPFPYNLFWWEGLDGSRVLSHLFKKNNAVLSAGDLVTRWEDDRIQQEGISGMMYPFGYGDGGGGPTREMVETARRCRDLEGAPRCRMESPLRFFERAESQGVDNVYTGELYLAWHRGTLTSQAKTKRGIRKAEIALKQVEFLLAQRLLAGKPILPRWKEQLESWWTLTLFNQFHDVAPGTSIARVHQRAEAELQQVIDGCHALAPEIAGEGEQRLHNHLSWDVTVHGQRIPAQGSAPIRLEESRRRTRLYREGKEWVLASSRLLCRVNDRGELVSVRIPGCDREFLSGPGNRFLMYKDVNTCYDAWEMASMYRELPVNLEGEVTVAPTADGTGLTVTRTLHESAMTQTIRLPEDAARVEFAARIHWQEKHKLLKVAFPVNVHTTQALHETQFGFIRRPTHTSRQHDRDQYEVCNHRYTALADGGMGAAVLNDSKYGVSVRDSEICLTLLKAPLMPDMTADRGEQAFTYAFCPFTGDFAHSEVLHEAVELNEPLLAGGGDSAPVFVPDAGNVVVETIRPADTAENALLVRAYEAMGMQTETSFALHPRIRQVVETNMLEEDPRPVCCTSVHFRAFEIKTFLLYL